MDTPDTPPPKAEPTARPSVNADPQSILSEAMAKFDRSDRAPSSHKRPKWPVIVLASILLLASFMLLQGRTTAPKQATPAQPPKSLTATTLNDFASVCLGDSIANAADTSNRGVRPIVLFSENVLGDTGYTVSALQPTSSSWRASSANFQTTQLVGCLKHKSVAATDVVCNLSDGISQSAPVTLYTVVYQLDVYSAHSRQKLGSSPVTGTSKTCPTVATYSQSDPRLYAQPDQTSLDAAVEEFVVL